MGKTFRPYLPEQDLLLPPSLREWQPEIRLAYFVPDAVDQLDLSTIESVYEKEGRSQPPYHPQMPTISDFSKLQLLAPEGSKVRANASKPRAMSYGRMKETAKGLREEVKSLLSQAKAGDEE